MSDPNQAHMIPDSFACAEIECKHLEGRTLVVCEEERCCFTFQRRREEDAIERERKDAQRPAEEMNWREGASPCSR